MNQTASAMLMRRLSPLRAFFAFAVLMLAALAAHAQPTPPPPTSPTNCNSFTELVTLIDVSRNIAFDCDGTINFEAPITIAVDTEIDGSGGNVTLSGNDVTRLFTIESGATLTLRNLTLTKGRAANGGAILIRPGGKLDARDCTFSANTALGGNGAAGQDGDADVGEASDGEDGAPGVSGAGGAIHNLGILRVVRCKFTGNSATGGDGGNGGKGGNGGFASGDGGNGGNGGNGFGGAIYNNGFDADVVNCSLENNTAKGGKGGTAGTGGTTALVGVPGDGGKGGVGAGAGIHNISYIEITACTFASNSGIGGNSAAAGTEANGLGKDGHDGAESWGGGVANLATAVIVNSTFSTNKVTGGNGGNGGPHEAWGGDGGNGGNAYGGNLFTGAGGTEVTSSTFCGGTVVPGTNGLAGTGGENGDPGRASGGNVAAVNAGVLRLRSSILARPTTGGNGYGSVRDFGYNISSDSTIPLPGFGSRANLNPRLLGLAENGGPTRTFALRDDSPAINRGDPEFSPPRDQRGRLRSDPDCGAFEIAIGELAGEVVTADGTGVPNILIRISTNVTDITGESGLFSFESLPSTTYTVTPVSTNFTFEPPSETVDLGATAFVSFIATPLYRISGRVTQGTNGLTNVTVRAFNSTLTNSVTTRSNGTYTIGPVRAGDYTVEPVQTGLVFTPQVRNITLDRNITNADFTAGGLQTVSGRITDGTNPIPNVTVTVGDQNVTTDTDGNYSVSGLGPYTYTIVPTAPGRGFEPPSRSVNLQTSAAGINFTAFQGFAISGAITNILSGTGLGNVVFTLTNTNSTNNTVSYSTTSVTNGGVYVFNGVIPGTYILRPNAANLGFSPRSREVTVGPDQTNQNFGGFTAYTLSGRASSGNLGVSNVTITLVRGAGAITTNTLIITTNTLANGTYSVPELVPDSYRVSASRAGFNFSPSTNTVLLTNNAANVNFTAQGVLSISGVILKDGAGLPNVRVTSGSFVDVTDANGRYTLTGFPPGEHTVSPSLSNHDFDPPIQTLTLTGSSITNADLAAFRVFTISGQITANGANLPGVKVTAGDKVVFTGGNGVYTLTGVRGPSQNVVPELANYDFIPASTNISLPESITNRVVNFTGVSTLYKLGGRITENGVGVPGIPVLVGTLSGTTDGNGYYELPAVPKGLRTVQPQLIGYQFTPGFRTIDLQGPNTNLNFTAVGIYSISGRIIDGTNGIANVVVSAGTRSAVTDSRGNYTITELGPRQHTVTPVLAGYAFTPPDRAVSVGPDQSGVDFSGFASFNLAGIVTKLSNAAPFTNILVNLYTNGTNLTLTMFTDTNGGFNFTNLRSAAYTVSPSHAGHAFTPTNRVVAVPPSAGGLAFAGFPVFTMSGAITLAGSGLTNVALVARLNGADVARITNGLNGQFTLPALAAGNYELLPVREGFQFSPTSRVLTLASNTTALNFTASGIYSISGRVTTNGIPVDRATITVGSLQAETDSAGNYAVTNLPPGTYPVTAAFPRFSFQPASTNITVGPSRSDVHFAGVQTFSISGRITELGLGLSNVIVTAGGRSGTTDANGNYVLSGVPGGAVTVVPTRTGYQITPALQTFVLENTTNGVDFAARGLYFIRGRVVDVNTNGLPGITNTAGRYFAVSDAAGDFTITNVGPGTYNVIPSFPGRGFAPGLISATVPPSANNVNFTSFHVFKLAGRITREGTTNSISGVSVRVTSPFATNTALTDSAGGYQFPALREATYTVTPTRVGDAFNPVNLVVDLSTDNTNANFEGYTAFSISGRVTENGIGLPNVEITPAGSTNFLEPVFTDNNGFYTIPGLRPATYTVTPIKPGYNLTPLPPEVTVGPNAANVNFTASAVLTLSGLVVQGTNRISAIQLTLTSTNIPPDVRRTAITDTNGHYEFRNLAPRTYTLKPEPAGIFTQTNGLPKLGDDSFLLDLSDYAIVNFQASAGQLAIFKTPTNRVILRVTGLPSRSHTIEGSASAVGGPWTNVVTVFTDATNGVREYSEPLRTNAGPVFFRIRR